MSKRKYVPQTVAVPGNKMPMTDAAALGKALALANLSEPQRAKLEACQLALTIPGAHLSSRARDFVMALLRAAGQLEPETPKNRTPMVLTLDGFGYSIERTAGTKIAERVAMVLPKVPPSRRKAVA